MEIGNLLEKEFTVIIVKMIQDLGKRMETQIEKTQEMFNKDLEELKNRQTEMKSLFHANRNQKKAGVAILVSDKIDFKILF